MIIAKGYVQTAKTLYTPGEIIPEDVLSVEDREWFQRIGMIRITETPKARNQAKAPEKEAEKPAPAEIPEIEPEETTEAEAPEVDAADAVVIPKATKTRKKGGKRG